MTPIKAGDTVSIHTGRRGGAVTGEVVKIGRTLAHIRYHGRTETFRLDTQIMTGPQIGYATYYETAEDAILRERREAALATLKEHDIEIRMGRERNFALEQIEALAEVARTFTETTED
jgi:hypothetical protein